MIVFRLPRGKCGQSPLPVAYPSSQMNPATLHRREEWGTENNYYFMVHRLAGSDWRCVCSKGMCTGDMLCPAEGIKVRWPDQLIRGSGPANVELFVLLLVGFK